MTPTKAAVAEKRPPLFSCLPRKDGRGLCRRHVCKASCAKGEGGSGLLRPGRASTEARAVHGAEPLCGGEAGAGTAGGASVAAEAFLREGKGEGGFFPVGAGVHGGPGRSRC